MKTKIALFTAIAAVTIIALAGMFASCPVDPPPVPITVSFDSNGGSEVASVTINRGQSLGAQFPQPPTNEPNTFIGWFDGDTEYTPNTVINIDLELKANWMPPPVDQNTLATVTFNVTDGGIPAIIQPITVVKGKSIGTRFPLPPRKEGNKFNGWVIGSTTTAFTSATVVNSDITVTAKWTVITTTYKVKFTVEPPHAEFNTKLNGLEIEVFENDCIDDWKVQFPQQVNTAPAPSDIQYYRFNRWENAQTANGVIFDGRTPITANVTLYAKFLRKVYPKTFEIPLTRDTVMKTVGNAAQTGHTPMPTWNFDDGVTLEANFTANTQYIWVITPDGAAQDDFRKYIGLTTRFRFELEGEAEPSDTLFNVWIGSVHAGSNWSMNSTKGPFPFMDSWEPYDPDNPFDPSNVPFVSQISNYIDSTDSGYTGDGNRQYFIIRNNDGDHTNGTIRLRSIKIHCIE